MTATVERTTTTDALGLVGFLLSTGWVLSISISAFAGTRPAPAGALAGGAA